MMPLAALAALALGLFPGTAQERRSITISNLTQLAEVARQENQVVRMEPGTYRMADYLTADVLREIGAGIDRQHRRPPVPMMVFSGNNNRFELENVTIEIDTTLYSKLPGGGYVRCLIVSGSSNLFKGLTVRNTGPQRGSGGNIVSVAGADNVLEDVTLVVHGSFPYGYGDLLGKGGPNLVGLQKQSGVQVLGARTLLRRCKVFSRAFGHCFYVQGGENVRLEDCYAEGVMRPTAEMLSDTNGPAFNLGFKSVAENRDGRYLITAGYIKSLVEDGFRTYSSAENLTLINCTAVNTRAGFEIGARDDSEKKTVVENCVARGCERAYLIGSHVVVRRSRGDVLYGPLLYLRGGRDSDIELELDGGMSGFTVHALATLAGTNHRVRLTRANDGREVAQVPIMLGFGAPASAEMASPIRPAAARRIVLENRVHGAAVIQSEMAQDCIVETSGKHFADADLRKRP